MGRNFWHRIVTAAVVSALPGYALMDVAAKADPRKSATAQAPASVAAGLMQLQVRRLGNYVELVVEGAGPRPQLQQSARGSSWQGQLFTASQAGLRAGPQRISLPELGIQSVSLEGSGSSYSLLVTPMPGVPLARPVVSADGLNLILTFPTAPQASLQTNRLNLNQPEAVPLPTYTPPLQARAVAPPLGDMAVGTMTALAPGTVNVSGPRVSMTFLNAPATSVLFALARIGGYGFVAMPDTQSCKLGVEGKQQFEESGTKSEDPRITMAFRGESYSRAVNVALRASSWGGVLEGNTIYAGRSILCDSAGQSITKVLRLNQADPERAVAYLATFGALGKRPNLKSILITSGPTASERQSSNQLNQQEEDEELEIQLFRSPTGPLLGLEASFDKRLGLVTLVGRANIVAMGEQYLRQFDLRKRQVALAITILDLDLSNDSSLSSSFAYRSGNNFIVNDAGRLFANLGNTGKQPAVNVPNGDFVAFLQAQIVSQSAKVLANPTLIMQEGEELGSSQVGSLGVSGVGSAVNVGSSVVTNFNVQTDSNGVTTCNPAMTTAGLTMAAKVDKVDDNGFVTFLVAPNISAPVGTQIVPGCGVINILNSRSLATSKVRVRDGQTLILTGVISDEDRAVVTKWPVLGDIPLIGSLFRSSGRVRNKRELIILVTPRIVNDVDGGVHGYGYRPSSPQARDFMGSVGY